MDKEIKPYRILVVEDNPGDFFLLQEYLGQCGLAVEKLIHAESLSAADSIVRENLFDIALLDLTLPDSTGVDSVITLGRLLPQTPIVVFSGLSTIEIAVESISLGAQDYLIKGEFDGKLLAKSIQYSIERKKTTKKLRESNERYEFVNKATQDTIWEWNYLTQEGLWGKGLIKTFGYTEDRLKYNESWMNNYIHPDDKGRVEEKIQHCIKNKLGNWEDEYRFRSADGSYKHVFDRGYVLFDSTGKPQRMIGAMTDITQRKKLEEELLNQQLTQQRLITEATIHTQEKERNELGRELHDNINQILATVKMYLGMTLSGQGHKEELLAKSYEYLTQAMTDIRNLSHSLVAPSLGDIGLKEALEELVDDSNLVNNVQVHLKMDDSFSKKALSQNKELMLYRIVQEQLNNIHKYAKARNAVINVKAVNGHVLLSVSDDGVGFDTCQKTKGIGLKNIINRVEFYAGRMKIISAPGKGCMLEVLMPL